MKTKEERIQEENKKLMAVIGVLKDWQTEIDDEDDLEIFAMDILDAIEEVK